MMLGCNDDVLHPCFFGHANPGVWIVMRRVELLGVLLIFIDRYATVMHYPLADILNLLALVYARWHCIDAPVDKQPEPSFSPPGHTISALLLSLGCVRPNVNGISRVNCCSGCSGSA